MLIIFLAVAFLVFNAPQYSITTSNLPLITEDVLPLNTPLEGIIFLKLKTAYQPLQRIFLPLPNALLNGL